MPNDQAGNPLAELVDAGSTEDLHDADILADVLEHPRPDLVGGQRVDANVRQAQPHVEGSALAQLQHLAQLDLQAGRHDFLNLGGRLRQLDHGVVREARVAVPVQRLRVVDAVPAQPGRQVRDGCSRLLARRLARGDGLEEHVVDVALRDGRVALALQAGVQIILLAVQEAKTVDDANVEHRGCEAATAPVGRQPVHVHVCRGVVGLAGVAADGGERRRHDEEVEVGRVEDGVEVAGADGLGSHDALQRLDGHLRKDAVVKHHGAVDDAADGRAGGAGAGAQLVAPERLRVVGWAAAGQDNVAGALLGEQLAERLAEVARDADEDVGLVRAEHVRADGWGRQVRDVALGAPVDDLEGGRGRGGAVEQVGDGDGGCGDGLVARWVDLQGLHVGKLNNVLQVAVAHLGDGVRQELTAGVVIALAGGRPADQGRHRRGLVQEVVHGELAHPSKDVLDGCARLVAVDKRPARVAYGKLPVQGEDGDLVLRRREELHYDVVQAHVGLHQDDAVALGLVHARHDRQGPEGPGGAGCRSDGGLWRVKDYLTRGRLHDGRVGVAEESHGPSLAVQRELAAKAQVTLVGADVDGLGRAVENLDWGIDQGIRLGDVAGGGNARVNLDLVGSCAGRCGSNSVDAVDGRPVRQHARDETPTLLHVDLGLVGPEHLAALAGGELALAEAAKGLVDDWACTVEHLEIEQLEVKVGDLGEERAGKTKGGCVLGVGVSGVEGDPQNRGSGPHQGANVFQACRRHGRQNGRVQVREDDGCSASGKVLLVTKRLKTGFDVVDQRSCAVVAAAYQQKLGSERWRTRSSRERRPEHILEGRLRLTNRDGEAGDVLLVAILDGIDKATLLEDVGVIRWGDGQGRVHGLTRASTKPLSKRAKRHVHEQEPGAGVHQGVHPLEESHRVAAGNGRHDDQVVLVPLLVLFVQVLGEDPIPNGVVGSLQKALLKARLDFASHGEGGK
ncbi:hypothetical protein PspLS_04136 [Pyricularia sp. CBS 133598]|nr:hypothetical protein PspLS_04136 [Pyricularia sp. CBS 133598]